jgi:hypothetical protein
MPFDFMLFIRVALGAVSVCAYNEIEHLRNRTERLVFGILILQNDQLIGLLDACSTKGRDDTVFIAAQNNVECVEEPRVRGI